MRWKLLFVTALFVEMVSGCSPFHSVGKKDSKDPCGDKPRTLKTDLVINVDLTLGKVVTGSFNFDVDKKVKELVGEAIQDMVSREYLRCIAKARGYTDKQVDYFLRFNAFMSTKPTADQYIEWEKGNPIPEPTSNLEPVLSPIQDRLLEILAGYQLKFSTTKLIILRVDGSLHLDGGDSTKATNISVIRDLYGPNQPRTPSEFEMLMENMPLEYLRFFHDNRLDSPFVVGVTERGILYLQKRHQP